MVFLASLLSTIAWIIFMVIAQPIMGSDAKACVLIVVTVFPLIATAFMYAWMTKAFFKTGLNRALAIALIMMSIDLILDVVILAVLYGGGFLTTGG